MYRKDLQKLLDGTYFPNFFALYGADNFQIELFAKLIKEKFAPQETLQIFFEEYSFQRISDYLGMPSLFSEKKLLELKCTKKPSSKELKSLISLCKNSNESFFLLELYDESSRQSELEKLFENNFARFFKANGEREGIELLALKAKELNITYTNEALRVLYNNFDENLYLGASELNKFQGLEINAASIEKYCYSLSVIPFEAFFDKLLKGDELRTDLDKILENFNEIALINTLNSNFHKLFKITTYAKIHGKIDLKELLGYEPPKQVADKLKTQALALKINTYQEIFKLLLESEYELKSNAKLSKKEFLIAMFLNLAKILKK